jgi:Ni,Fe-hydrogenase III small subunit
MSEVRVSGEQMGNSDRSGKSGAEPPRSFEQDIFATMFGPVNLVRAYDTYLATCADTPETRQILDGIRQAATKYEEALSVVLCPPKILNPPS